MSDDGLIVVEEEARTIMRGLEANDPGAPSRGAVRQVTGAGKSAGAAYYRERMQTFADDSRKGFEDLLSYIRKDCEVAVKAIDDMQQQDQEIMMLLKKYDEEAGAIAVESAAVRVGGRSTGGGLRIQPPGNDSSDTSW